MGFSSRGLHGLAKARRTFCLPRTGYGEGREQQIFLIGWSPSAGAAVISGSPADENRGEARASAREGNPVEIHVADSDRQGGGRNRSTSLAWNAQWHHLASEVVQPLGPVARRLPVGDWPRPTGKANTSGSQCRARVGSADSSADFRCTALVP